MSAGGQWEQERETVNPLTFSYIISHSINNSRSSSPGWKCPWGCPGPGRRPSWPPQSRHDAHAPQPNRPAGRTHSNPSNWVNPPVFLTDAKMQITTNRSTNLDIVEGFVCGSSKSRNSSTERRRTARRNVQNITDTALSPPLWGITVFCERPDKCGIECESLCEWQRLLRFIFRRLHSRLFTGRNIELWCASDVDCPVYCHCGVGSTNREEVIGCALFNNRASRCIVTVELLVNFSCFTLSC